MKIKKSLLSIATAGALLGGTSALFGIDLETKLYPGVVNQPTALKLTAKHSGASDISTTTQSIVFELNPKEWDLTDTLFEWDTGTTAITSSASTNMRSSTLTNGIVVKATSDGDGFEGNIETFRLSWNKAKGAFLLTTHKGVNSTGNTGIVSDNANDTIQLIIPASFGIKPISKSAIASPSSSNGYRVGLGHDTDLTPTVAVYKDAVGTDSAGTVKLEFNTDNDSKVYGVASAYKITVTPNASEELLDAANSKFISLKLSGIGNLDSTDLSDDVKVYKEGSSTALTPTITLVDGVLKIAASSGNDASGAGKKVTVVITDDANPKVKFANPTFADASKLRVSATSSVSGALYNQTDKFANGTLTATVDDSKGLKATFKKKGEEAKAVIGDTFDVELALTAKEYDIQQGQLFRLTFPKTITKPVVTVAETGPDTTAAATVADATTKGTENEVFFRASQKVEKGNKLTIKLTGVKLLAEDLGAIKVDFDKGTSAVSNSADSDVDNTVVTKLYPTLSFDLGKASASTTTTAASLDFKTARRTLEIEGKAVDGVNGTYTVTVAKQTAIVNAQELTLNIEASQSNKTFKEEQSLSYYGITEDKGSHFTVDGQVVKFKKGDSIKELVAKLDGLAGFSAKLVPLKDGSALSLIKHYAESHTSIRLSQPGDQDILEKIFGLESTKKAYEFKISNSSKFERFTGSHADFVAGAIVTLSSTSTSPNEAKAPKITVAFQPENDPTSVTATADTIAFALDAKTGTYNKFTSSLLGFTIKGKAPEYSLSEDTYTIIAKGGKFVGTAKPKVSLTKLDATPGAKKDIQVYFETTSDKLNNKIGAIRVTLPQDFKKGEEPKLTSDSGAASTILVQDAAELVKSGNIEFAKLGMGTTDRGDMYVTIPSVSFDEKKVKEGKYPVKVEYKEIGSEQWVALKADKALEISVTGEDVPKTISTDVLAEAAAGSLVKIKPVLKDQYGNTISAAAKTQDGHKIKYVVKGGGKINGKTEYTQDYVKLESGKNVIQSVDLVLSETEGVNEISIALVGNDKVKPLAIKIDTAGVSKPVGFGYKATKTAAEAKVGTDYDFSVNFVDANGKATAFAKDTRKTYFKISNVDHAKITKIAGVTNTGDTATISPTSSAVTSNGLVFSKNEVNTLTLDDNAGFKKGQKLFVYTHDDNDDNGEAKDSPARLAEVEVTAVSEKAKTVTVKTVAPDADVTFSNASIHISSAVLKRNGKIVHQSKDGVFDAYFVNQYAKQDFKFKTFKASNYDLTIEDDKLFLATKTVKPFATVTTIATKAVAASITATDNRALADGKDALVFTLQTLDSANNPIKVAGVQYTATATKGHLINAKGERVADLNVTTDAEGQAVAKVVSDYAGDEVSVEFKDAKKKVVPTTAIGAFFDAQITGHTVTVGTNPLSRTVTLELKDAKGIKSDAKLSLGQFMGGVAPKETPVFKDGKATFVLTHSKAEKVDITILSKDTQISNDYKFSIDFSKSAATQEYKAAEKASLGANTVNIKGADLSKVSETASTDVQVNGNTLTVDAKAKSITFGTSDTTVPVQLQTNYILKFK